jgi:hypothetical protein
MWIPEDSYDEAPEGSERVHCAVIRPFCVDAGEDEGVPSAVYKRELAEVVFGEFAVTYGEIYYGIEEFWGEVCGVVHFILSWVGVGLASSVPV